MTTLITGTPLKWGRGSTAVTVPEMLAWTGAETKAGASPTFCPTSTWSPTATQGVQGAPMCMDMGITTWAGGGSFSIGFLLVAALWSLGWMPPKKGCAMIVTSFFFPRILSQSEFAFSIILLTASPVQRNLQIFAIFLRDSSKSCAQLR